MATQTGLGTTFSVGGTGGCIRSVTLPEFSQEAIDVSCLDSTGFMEKIKAGLADPGECSATVLWEDDYTPPTIGDESTLTITLPDSSTFSGSGWVSGISHGSAEVGSVIECTITFTFDGATGPTFTNPA